LTLLMVLPKVDAMDRAESTALLREARAGSPDALDRLYTRVANRLLGFIRVKMGPSLRARLESRDILQATLLKSFERIEQFEGATGSSLVAWLARIAENEIRDRADHAHRARRDVAREVPLEPASAQVAAHVRSALSQAVLTEEAERVERALESLEPPHREVILLRKYEELGFKEIAVRMGRSEDACRMLLARAMAALTLALEP
jgi:RNA polymerase sigma-70 factor (ECF subfamily)